MHKAGTDEMLSWIPPWQQVSEPVSDPQLYAYLTRLAVVANKLAAQMAARRREETAAQPANTPADISVSNKLPRGVLKALMAYFKQLALAKQQDPVDANLKRSYLAFYAQLLELRSDRLPEFNELGVNAGPLIVKFVTCVTKVAGASQVDVQSKQFVELLRNVAKKQGGSAALDVQLATQAASFNQVREPTQREVPPRKTETDDIATQIGRVMLVSPSLLEQDLAAESSTTLEGTAEQIDQLKHVLEQGQHPVYCPDDFKNKDAWQDFVLAERRQLDILKQQFPVPGKLVNHAPPDLVPPNVRAYFRLLLQRCIDADRKASTLFTAKTRTLLQYVASYWRIPVRTYVTCLLNATSTLFDKSEVSVETVNDVYSYVEHMLKDSPESQSEWPKSDKLLSLEAVQALRQVAVYRIVECLRELFAKKTPKMGAYLHLLEITIPPISNALGQQIIVSPAQVKQIKQSIVSSAKSEYERLVSLIPRDSTLEVEHVVQLTQAVVKVAERLQNKYRQPMFDQLPIAKMVCAQQLNLLGKDFVPIWEYALRQYNAREEEPPFNDMIALHNELLQVQDLYTQVSLDENLPFNPEALLFPYFAKWAATSATMSRTWVKPVIEQDDNTPLSIETGKMHSSAVQDLFTSFYASLSLIENLNWQNQYHVARLLTTLVDGIASTLCDWASQVHALFLQEFKPAVKPRPPSQKQEEQWLSFAKEATAQATAAMMASRVAQQPEPFEFKREAGVKLNNIAAAYAMLHQMEAQLRSDAVSKRIEIEDRKQRQQRPTPSYLFTVTVIGASDVKLSDGGVYVTLVDQDTRKQLGKTRTTLGNTSRPQWNEPFELEASRPRLLKATVWSENAASHHTMCGRAMLKLDPKQFAQREYGMQIKWIDLDSGKGRLQFMISVDVQRDDIRFHFGKALRFLTRSQDSMVSTIVNQFSGMIDAVISKQTLRYVTGQGSIATSVQTGVTQLHKSFNSWFGNAQTGVQPPVMTQKAIDDSLEPLYDYLNKNFATLAAILTSELRIEVLSRTWDVVLEVLELLILPPLEAERTSQQQLSSTEMEAVYTWLSSLRDFFYSDGAGPSLERLQSQSYQQIVAIPVYYDLPTSQLKLESEKIVKTNLRTIASNNELLARQRTVMAHRNKSVIEHQAVELRNAQRASPRLDDVILRILRLRGETSFIEQHLRFRDRLLQREMTEKALQGSLF